MQWQQLMPTAPNGKPLTLWSVDRLADGRILVGGQWQDAGGARRYTALLAADGSSVTPFAESVDGYDDGFYGKPGATAKNAVSSANAEFFVVRSGSWIGGEGYLRAGYRNYVEPKYSHYDVGVRCAHPYP